MRLSPVEIWAARKTGLGKALNRQTLEAWQMARIREAMARVRSESPFYARILAHADIGSLRSWHDLDRIPLTLPSDIASDPQSLLCVSGAEVARIATLRTSGRTGEAKRIFFSDADIELTTNFFGMGMTTLTRKGQHVSIMMSGTTENSIADLLKKGIERYGRTGEIHGHVHDIASASAAAERADCIVGVPAEILRLCRAYPSLRPKSLLLSADYVPESVVAAIREMWGCEIYTHYGMTEAGYACAVQCDARGDYHLRCADMLIEIIDPESGLRLPDGHEGEVVVTTFAHSAMPLIRYRTGDIACLNSAPCPCGGVLPRLSKVRGRRGGALLAGGAEIRIEELDEIMYAIPGLRGYRAELAEEGERIKLRLTVDSAPSASQALIFSQLAAYLGGLTDADVRFGELPPSQGRDKRRIFQA